MKLSKFTANCAQSAQFAHPCPESLKFMQSMLISQDSLSPLAKIAKIYDICALLYFRRFCAIHTRWETTQAGANSVKSTINVLIHLHFIILDVCQEMFQDPVWANYANSTTLRCNSQKIKFFKYFKIMVLSALCTY